MKLYYYNTFINSKSGSRIHSRNFIEMCKEELGSNFEYYPQYQDETLVTNLKSKKVSIVLKMYYALFKGLIKSFKVYSMLKSKQNSGFKILARYDQFELGLLMYAFKYDLYLEVNSPMHWELQKSSRGIIFYLMKLYEVKLWKKSKRIFSVSTQLKSIIENHSISDEKIFVIPNGSSLKPLNVIPKLSLDYYLIVFSGSMKEWHNISSIYEVFHNFIVKNKQVKLLILGGDKVENLENDNIEFLGNIPQEETYKYLNSANLLIAPYKKLENFYFSPLKIFEYMSFNKPILTNNVGQIGEILDENSAFFDDFESTIQLRSKIEYILLNHDLSAAKGQNAYDIFIKNYTWYHNYQLVTKFIGGE